MPPPPPLFAGRSVTAFEIDGLLAIRPRRDHAFSQPAGTSTLYLPIATLAALSTRPLDPGWSALDFRGDLWRVSRPTSVTLEPIAREDADPLVRLLCDRLGLPRAAAELLAARSVEYVTVIATYHQGHFETANFEGPALLSHGPPPCFRAAPRAPSRGSPRYPAGMRRLLCTFAALVVLACGDDGRAMTETSTTNPTTTPTTPGTTGDTPTTTDPTAATTTGQSASATEAEGTGQATQTTTDAATTGLTTSTSATTGTTDPTTDPTTESGGFVCDPNQVEDTLAFTYVSQFDTGIPDAVLQASYYNSDADEVMIMSFSGKARRFKVDGTPLSDVFDVPPAALPKLDGATYDPLTKVGLLINQDCVLNEVEPKTLAILKTQPLGFGMSICAGLALGLDNNLYIASYGTDEMVTISRDGSQELGRVNVVQAAGLDGFDGIALIAGSENFLIMSTAPTTKAAIVNPAGGVVVAASDLGQAAPPMIGGMPDLPDAVLTLCGNGHAWVCEAYKATCFDYAPEDGDKNACACLIPQ